MRQLLDQWSHPAFSSIEGFSELLEATGLVDGRVETGDWTRETLPSWMASIWQGVLRPEGPGALRLARLHQVHARSPDVPPDAPGISERGCAGSGCSARGGRPSDGTDRAVAQVPREGGMHMADAQVRSSAGIKQFFGLSRMTHSVLDVAHPAVGGALAAVLLGGPPSCPHDHHGARCRFRGLHLRLRAQRRDRREGRPGENGEVPGRPRRPSISIPWGSVTPLPRTA